MTATQTLTYGAVAPTNPNDGDQWLKPVGTATVYEYRWNTTLAAWEMHSAGVPPGGTPGQILAKTTAADYDNQWVTPATGTPPDATTTSKGIVQLAGDLAGTAASPQIAAGAIVNADIAAAAAIAASKLAGYPNDQTTVLRGDGSWLAAPRITYGTTPPASPADGDGWIYPADATNGVIWQFRYRAASSSPYKWECIGGPPIIARVDTTETITTVAAWVNAATVGPSYVVPRAGDYDCTGWTTFSATTTIANCQNAIGIGDYTSGYFVNGFASVPLANGFAAANATGTGTAIAAASELRMKYFVGASANVRQRVMAITPVRVS
jgi:uncharacterized protein DUF5907